jgi:hypothetical protein
MLARLIGVFALFLIAGGFVVGNADEQQVDADPSGTWKWERTFNENKIDYTLRLNWHDDKLTGTCQAVMENGPPGLSDPVKIDDAKLEGDKISFTITRSFNGNEFTVAYGGSFDGDELEGSVKLDFRDREREFDWNANRVLSKDDVIGTWQFRSETPNGNVRESTLTLSEDGKKLKGELVSERGERELNNIAIEDNQLSFEIIFEREGNSFTVAYKGTPRGDSMKGTLEFNFNGEPRKTDVEGKRMSKKPGDSKPKKESSES